VLIAAEFVMDASFALPWVFRDEANRASDAAWKSLVTGKATAHVPGLWPMEMVNVVLRGPRATKVRPTDRDVDQFFAILRKMPLSVHHQGLGIFLDRAPTFMGKHELTAYDSAYLILASASGLPLATLDKRLRKAARAEGLKLLG
jgi:predicted nucleic acid-binding protein